MYESLQATITDRYRLFARLMKTKIYIYLLIFSVLTNLFQYVNSSRILEAKEEKLIQNEVQLSHYQDSIRSLRKEMTDLQLFSLEFNGDASSYLYDAGIQQDQIRYLTDQVYELNEAKGTNLLIGYEAMERPFKINQIRVLNHRWMIANFTDGTLWGELLIKYFVNEDQTLDLETVEEVLYP